MTARKAPGWSTRRQFVDGTLLTSSDLQRDAEREESLRALHVRGVHDTWGIALGMRVWVSAARDRVLVGPGVAYNARGEAIYVAHSTVLLVPVRAAGSAALALDLFVRRRAVIDPRFDGVCPDRSLAIAERPEWRWSFAGDALYGTTAPFADDVRLGLDIPVVRFRVANNGRVGDPDLSTRRTARRLTRPHVAGGRVLGGSIPIVGSVWHWSATIDTSTGGFSSARPRYMASLCGHPLLSPTQFSALAALDKALKAKALLGPLVSLRNESTRSFTIDVRLATNTSAHFQSAPAAWLAEVGKTLPVDVTWTGFEDVSGCSPSLGSLVVNPNGEPDARSFTGFSTAAALAAAVVFDPTA